MSSRQSQKLERDYLSPSAVLVSGSLQPARLETHLACVQSRCAAFYLTESGYLGGVQLDADGRPSEPTRVDLGRGGDGFVLAGLQAITVGANYVLSFRTSEVPGTNRLYLLDSSSLERVTDWPQANLPSAAVLYSDQTSLIAVNVDNDTDKSRVYTLDPNSGKIVGEAPLISWWRPIVIPGAGQYLFFYPDYGCYRRLDAASGQWLEEYHWLSSTTDLFATEATGFYQAGIYQLAFRSWSPPAPAGDQLYGLRVDASSGALLGQTTANVLTTQSLCESCSGVLEGTLRTRDSALILLRQDAARFDVLKLVASTGERADPLKSNSDFTFASPEPLEAFVPEYEPRLSTANHAIYKAAVSEASIALVGEPAFPSVSSGVRSAAPSIAGNGQSFLAVWNDSQGPQGVFVRPDSQAEHIEESLAVKLDLENAGALASAAGDYLLAGVAEDSDGSILLQRQRVSSNGMVSPVQQRSTGILRGRSEVPRLRLASDGERYGLALFVGSIAQATGRIYVQRLSPSGAELDALRLLTSDAQVLDSIDVNFADSDPRDFVVSYRTGGLTRVRLLPASGGAASEVIEFGEASWIWGNDGRNLLFGKGPSEFHVRDRTITPLDLPGFEPTLLAHWDGNAYIALQQRDARLGVSRLDRRLFATDFQTVDSELESSDFGVGSGGHGLSLVAYFSAAPPLHAIDLRGALFRTVPEPAEGGAGGAPSPPNATTDGGTPNQAGAGGTPILAGGAASGGESNPSAGAGGDASQTPRNTGGADAGESSLPAGATSIAGGAGATGGPQAISGEGGAGEMPSARKSRLAKGCTCGFASETEGAALTPSLLALLLLRRQRRRARRSSTPR